MSDRVIIVPCSGIGKTYGSVTREAAYMVAEELRPDQTAIVPLSLLVLGDQGSHARVQGAQVITIDGCKLACATVNVRQAGGCVAREYAVLDFYRQHKNLKPQGIAELNAGGQALARALAEEIAQTSDELLVPHQVDVGITGPEEAAPASASFAPDAVRGGEKHA